MASYNNAVFILVLFAVLAVTFARVSQGGPHTSQGKPHENQGRIKRQADEIDQGDQNELDGQNEQDNQNEQGVENEQDDQITDEHITGANWTTCDFTVRPTISCHDCNTRLICKPIGGILKGCNNPYKPYCSNGICSPFPTPECA